MLSVNCRPPREPLWYVSMMQPRTLTADPRPAAVSRETPPTDGPRPVPAVVYADCLYQPVPPVEFDDQGYPGPDGKMSASTRHAEAATYAFDAARMVFRDRPDVLVAYDLLLLFEEGNPKAALGPDMMVVLDAGNAPRSSYKVWEEDSRPPDFVLEVMSKSTWRRDTLRKPGLYAAVGVREYWLFDPRTNRLAGFRLDGDAFTRIRAASPGVYRSAVLGLDLLVEDGELRFRDLAGENLPDAVQAMRMREEESARRRAAQARAAGAQAQAAQAEAQAAQAQAQAAQAQAQAAQAQAHVAEAEARARQAEARVAELEQLRRRPERP